MEKVQKYLEQHGYLDSYTSPTYPHDITEEDLIDILKNHDAPTRLFEGLPFIIANEKFDLTKLTKQALSNNLQNKLGYLLEKTKELVGNSILSKYNKLDIYLEILYQQATQEKQSFNTFDKMFKEYKFEDIGELEKKWKVYSKLNFEHSAYSIQNAKL